MIHKYNKILLLFLFITGLILTGCSKHSALSKEEVLEFDSYITSLTSEKSFDVYELQEKISTTIPKIENKDEASSIFNKYIYILYNEAKNYLPYFDIIGEDISDIKNNLEIKKLDVSMYKKISKESKIIGAILEEMYNKDLMIVDENNSFYTEVNIEKILNKYRNYLNNDTIEFLEFRASEITIPIFDANSDRYNLDVLLERAALSIKKANEKTASEQLGNWKSSAAYYYEIILVDNMRKILNEDVEAINSYIKEIKINLETYKDSELYADINKYIELLESNEIDIDNTDVASYRDTLLESILNE